MQDGDVAARRCISHGIGCAVLVARESCWRQCTVRAHHRRRSGNGVASAARWCAVCTMQDGDVAARRCISHGIGCAVLVARESCWRQCTVRAHHRSRS